MTSHDLAVGADAFLEDGRQAIDGVQFVGRDCSVQNGYACTAYDFTAVPLSLVTTAIMYAKFYGGDCVRAEHRDGKPFLTVLLKQPIQSVAIRGTVSI